MRYQHLLGNGHRRQKCRQAIRKMIEKHPNAFVVVIGCYAQLKPKEIADIEGVNLVLGTNENSDYWIICKNTFAKTHKTNISQHKSQKYANTILPALPMTALAFS